VERLDRGEGPERPQGLIVDADHGEVGVVGGFRVVRTLAKEVAGNAVHKGPRRLKQRRPRVRYDSAVGVRPATSRTVSTFDPTKCQLKGHCSFASFCVLDRPIAPSRVMDTPMGKRSYLATCRIFDPWFWSVVGVVRVFRLWLQRLSPSTFGAWVIRSRSSNQRLRVNPWRGIFTSPASLCSVMTPSSRSLGPARYPAEIRSLVVAVIALGDVALLELPIRVGSTRLTLPSVRASAPVASTAPSSLERPSVAHSSTEREST
jgi:hypothetical protein